LGIDNAVWIRRFSDGFLRCREGRIVSAQGTRHYIITHSHFPHESILGMLQNQLFEYLHRCTLTN
jgi:hypothetical protein